jgi:hypothetical protein
MGMQQGLLLLHNAAPWYPARPGAASPTLLLLWWPADMFLVALAAAWPAESLRDWSSSTKPATTPSSTAGSLLHNMEEGNTADTR